METAFLKNKLFISSVAFKNTFGGEAHVRGLGQTH